MTLDVTAVRADFPILERRVHDRPLVYLDSANTSQKPNAVIDAISDHYRNHNANIHRANHVLGEEATAAYEDAREKVASLLNAPPEGIVFTRQHHRAINLVARTWGAANLGAGDNVVLTQLEHHSNIVPWYILREEKGFEIRFIEVDDQQRLKLEQLSQKIDARTKLVSLNHVSNSTGTINPVAEVIAAAHRAGALCLVDGAQSVPHMPVDVKELDADFYGFTGHKALGPTGVGVLYARPELLEEMPPFLGGGEMIRRVDFERATFNDPPWKFEAGTPNIADVVGLGAAVDYLNSLGLDEVRAHERDLAGYALETLRSRFDGLTIYGPDDPEERGGIISLNFEEIHPHDLGQVLDSHGIAVRAGHHCTQPLMRLLGVSGTARASFHVYTNRGEVDALADGLEAARNYFRDLPGQTAPPDSVSVPEEAQEP
ncbi:MAG: SufS family cysteine desulfurase [Dehalococcoidia bacterium]|nr:SufS family cysteine desulfurase [Dehalococcoidia bacterium]